MPTVVACAYWQRNDVGVADDEDDRPLVSLWVSQVRNHPRSIEDCVENQVSHPLEVLGKIVLQY